MVLVNVSAYRMLSTEGAFMLVDTDVSYCKISIVGSLPSLSLALVMCWRQFTADAKKKLEV